MKKKILSMLVIVGLMVGLMAIPAQAATEDEIEESVAKGVEWLVGQQNPDGSWGDWDQVARTGFAVVKLEDRAYELGYDPFDDEYEYSENVIDGLDFIFGQAKSDVCGWYFGWGTYETGIAMMAIAAGRDMTRVVTVGPHTDLTYGEVLELNVDYFANSQISSGQYQGGWGYGCGADWADNSNSGYAVLGLRYAESAGIGIPPSLKDNLSIWIDYIQNDVDSDTNDGGSGYEHPDSWVNLLKTGNLLFEMAFVSDDTSTQRVKDAITYIQNHWNDPNWDPGWKGPNWLDEERPHMQAAYCLMKGLESFIIQAIVVGGSNIDWFDEMSTAIVETQQPDGSWLWDEWGDELLATEWALLTLERVVPPIPVPVDVKPMSCPNPLSVNKKGLLPVAILGTEIFDVTQIDPASVRLEGVAPLRWAYEDVATPVEPYLGKEDPYGCSEEGPDGYLDLTLKFDNQELVDMLGGVQDGEVLVLQLTGSLMDNGRDIIGEDVVVIIKKR